MVYYRVSLVKTLSWLYAMMLVVLGLVFPLTFFLSDGNRDSGVYLSVGDKHFIYLRYLAALANAKVIYISRCNMLEIKDVKKL